MVKKQQGAMETSKKEKRQEGHGDRPRSLELSRIMTEVTDSQHLEEEAPVGLPWWVPCLGTC